jgi:putative membrane protein
VKLPAVLSILIGLAVAVALIVANDPVEIGRTLLGAGWGILAVIALHLPQILFSSLGWQALVAEPQAPSRATFFCLRWIRESVNALLPVAQIGGEVVRAHLLSLRGISLKTASASVIVDLTMETASQIVFTLLGIILLLLGTHDRTAIHWIIAIPLIITALGAAFVMAQRLGLFRLVEHMLIRLAERFGWRSLHGIAGLHDAITALYRDSRRLWLAGGYHLASWLLGAVETMAALHVLGIDVGWREALIIESLGQAVRSLGFAMPGALGVQEGGYIVICGLLGISPQSAIALSLVRRIREIVLGVPGLIAWQRIEAHFAKRDAAARVEGSSSNAAWRGNGQ